MDPTLDARLRSALSRAAVPSSDFDLNPGFQPPKRALKPAAVLLAIVPGPAIVLTRRSSHLRHHPGQIAFPGGKIDTGDANATAAALREAREEVGLNPGTVTIFGDLPPHDTVTGYRITPVLGLVRDGFDPVPQPGEVDEVFHVPLAHLVDPAQYRVERRLWLGQWRSYYAVPWGPYYVWGATARILRGLAEALR